MEVSEEDTKDGRQDEEEEGSPNKSRNESKQKDNEQGVDTKEEEVELKEEDMEVKDEVTEEEEEETKDESMKVVDEVKEEIADGRKDTVNVKSNIEEGKQKNLLDGVKEVKSEPKDSGDDTEKNDRLQEKKLKSGDLKSNNITNNETENINKHTTDVDSSQAKNITEEGKTKIENTYKIKENKPLETTVKEVSLITDTLFYVCACACMSVCS